MVSSHSCLKRKLGMLLIVGTHVFPFSAWVGGANRWHAGLVGAWYHGDDLTRVGTCKRIMHLDQIWDANRGRGNNWSVQWVGFVTAPVDGSVTFYGQSNKEFILVVDGQKLVHVIGREGQTQESVSLVKGEKYPIHVKYLQHVGGTGQFKVMWNWIGQQQAPVPPGALCFSTAQAGFWSFVEEPNSDDFDFSTLQTIQVENYFAYRELGRFDGWPANNGAWDWGNEILVGSHQGYHDPSPSGGHAILSDRPQANLLARSLDGGRR